MDDIGKSMNPSSSEQGVSVNTTEKLNPISNTRKAAIAHKKTSDRITKRRIIRATYACPFLLSPNIISVSLR